MDYLIGHSISLSIKIWVATAAGLASHQLFFIKGEHHLHALLLLKIYLALCVLLVWIESGDGFQQATINTFVIIGAYALSLLSSMLIYRVLFHPLRNFPGPALARVSKLWHVYHILNSHNHLFLEGMRCQYGNMVRTGPSEITVFDPEVFQAIGGPGTTCIKSAWYDMLWPLIALNSIRERHGYALRRKLWDEALKPIAVRNDADRIFKYSDLLETHVRQSRGQPVNVCEWFSFFSFDLMGDLSFAKSFGMLEDGSWHYAVKLLRDGMAILGVATPVPWLAQICFHIPGVASSWNSMICWCKMTMTERLATDVENPDVSYWLIEASRKRGAIDLDMNNLYGDSIAVIIAGSDSVSSTLVYLFYEIALHPTTQEALRSELAKVPSLYDIRSLQDLSYLDAVINETLRLHPVVPTGGIRQAVKEGISIAGYYVPPYTTIVAPRYSIGRLESCFDHASDFIPERWTEKPEMVKDRRAFNPFSQGRHSCPGKHLGMMELRIVVANLVSKFEIVLASPADASRVTREMKDAFTAKPGPLELCFSSREGRLKEGKE